MSVERRPVPALLLTIVLLAALPGCITALRQNDVPQGLPVIVELPPLDLGHDHADPAAHPERAHGLRVLSALRLSDEGGAGRFVTVGDLVLVSLPGARTGLAVVDASEPASPKLLGAYRSEYGASEGEAIAVTPDGRFAFLGIETLYSSPPVAPAIEVIDLSDPASPRLAQRVPVAAQPHVLTAFEADGATYLIASDYHLTVAASGTLPESSAVSAGASFYRVDTAQGLISLVTRHTFDPREDAPGAFFTHDPLVVDHPVTGERLLYLAAFGGGGRILSLADAASPREIGVALDVGTAPVLRHHSFAPAPALVESALVTAAIPRSRAADGAAYLTLYDTADPTKPAFLGEWRHPDTDLVPGDLPPLNLHVPTFAKEGTRLLVPHFHAGLYVFDVGTLAAARAPTPVAYWMPPAGEAPSGAPVVSVVAMALEVGDVILATEAASGTLYALALDA